MLHIQNILKVGNKRILGGWKITDIDTDSITNRYIFVIECFSPIGVVMDRCTISLDRKGELLKTLTHPTAMTYFFNYNGDRTRIAGGADWLADIDNFTTQLEYIIKHYHNKQ